MLRLGCRRGLLGAVPWEPRCSPRQEVFTRAIAFDLNRRGFLGGVWCALWASQGGSDQDPLFFDTPLLAAHRQLRLPQHELGQSMCFT